jgi:branched-chain amino acid transport system ATP-binding protein
MSFFQSQNITISFGGLTALEDVSFDIEKGEIFAIIGPNGAGKTTIFNCINRFYDLDEGHFRFKDKDITRVRPHEVADLGIARTFQNIELFKNMTVIENLLLGRHRHRRTNIIIEAVFSKKVRKQEIESREKAEEVIDFLDLQSYRNQVVESLPYGIQKVVELARALTIEPELLLLDEPSSGMNVEETDDLINWMTDIKEEMGITLLLVEHNMRLVMDVSDRVVALNFGKVISQGTSKQVQNDPEVIKAYLGEERASIKS